ncbi:MAG TPA: prenyltransferase/squalene oxidase repeat-containing protein [Acidobacteriota bacterium]|nr:prenyltransferase/squalene oxidase repeat-containing protein [Acidobacteriota bacterium]
MYKHALTRRRFLKEGAFVAAGAGLGHFRLPPFDVEAKTPAEDTLAFIRRCLRDDGGYNPSPDPQYPGNSDTHASDLAAVTYALTIAKTLGWVLPNTGRSAEFVQSHQQKDGSFANKAGRFNPKDDLAILYNTTQAVVALRVLDQKPAIDPYHAFDRFFVGQIFKKLPWYTTSFFPLFYACLGKPFPREYDLALRDWLVSNQSEDGYVGDHVAATFHMAHYFRMVGRPTPRAGKMVGRVLRDQKPDGGWNIKEPDWDVHACFDAVFILRQLGGDSDRVRASISRAADWAMRCRNADGGFGHFPTWHSDMDAVYFQFGTLIQAGRVPAAVGSRSDGNTLSWGHAMDPHRTYGATT